MEKVEEGKIVTNEHFTSFFFFLISSHCATSVHSALCNRTLGLPPYSGPGSYVVFACFCKLAQP